MAVANNNLSDYNRKRIGKSIQNLQQGKNVKKNKKKLFKDFESGDVHRYFGQLESDFVNKQKSDFGNHYSPTDDIFSSTKTGANSDGRPAMQEMVALSEIRAGVAFKITRKFAEDATRNGFYFADMNRKEVLKPEIMEWWKNVDGRNQWTNACNYDCQVGAGFVVKYWGRGLDENGKRTLMEDMSKKPPTSPPKRVQAISALYMAPINTYNSELLDYDEKSWEFNGGKLNPTQNIHPDRIEVIITRPSSYDWRGLGVQEPVWLSLKSYFNCIVFLTKGIGKWGNTIPILRMGDSESNKNAFDKWLALMMAFQMNGFYIIGKDDSLDFVDAKLGAGMNEYLEILKEDIASGTSIPLAILFGRTVTSGLFSGGSLPHERTYMNELGNYQLAITDNVHSFIGKHFDLTGIQILWNLAIQKTKEQRLQEKSMELQIELLEQQVKSAKMENKMSKLQFDAIKANPELLNPPTENEKTEGTTESKPKKPKKPKDNTEDFSFEFHNELYLDAVIRAENLAFDSIDSDDPKEKVNLKRQSEKWFKRARKHDKNRKSFAKAEKKFGKIDKEKGEGRGWFEESDRHAAAAKKDFGPNELFKMSLSGLRTKLRVLNQKRTVLGTINKPENEDRIFDIEVRINQVQEEIVKRENKERKDFIINARETQDRIKTARNEAKEVFKKEAIKVNEETKNDKNV